MFREWQAADKALKQILLSAVDDIWIIDKNHQVTRYENVTTRRLIIHLYAKYGKITAEPLNENKQRMKKSYDTIQPFETLYTQMEQVISLSNAASTPFIQSKILAMAHTLVFKTGL